MKRFKKQISLLLTVALVLSSLVIGLGQITSKAYTDATGTGIFRVDIGIGSNDCANDHRGTNSSFRLQFLNAGGGVVSATPDNAITGSGSPDPLENGQTTTYTYNGSGGGNVAVTVPSLATLTVNKTITQVQLVNTSWADDWAFNNVVIYYSYDGGLNWITLANNGWSSGSSGAVATWSIGTAISGIVKTLTFSANGGTPDTYLDAIPGQTITQPGAPSRTGYTFSVWQSVPARMPNSAATYYAQWYANVYNISFNGNGATSGSMTTMTCAYGTAYTLNFNAFGRTGYTFSNWNTAANGSGTSYANGQSVSNLTATNGATFTLYAQWSPINYTVHYNGGTGATGSTANSLHDYNIPKNLTANGFEKTGYTFTGWSLTDGGALAFTNQQSVSNLTAANGATVELYAKWTPYTYYVSYDPVYPDVSGTTPSSEHTVGVPSSFSNNGFYRTGYSYQGWSRSDGLIVFDSSDLDSLVSYNGQTITIYAIWSANTYTINFNGNGATSGYMPPITFRTGEQIILPPNNFARTGYAFTGWALSPTGPVVYPNGAIINSLITIGSFTLYAKWTANMYTIVYNGNGSTGGSMSNSVHTYDVAKNLTANGYIKTGNTFLGWALTSYATEPTWENQQSVLNITSINGATVTFYAVWQANWYYITFDANGGTGSTGPTAMEYGSPLSAPTVTKTGYDFAGWTPSVPATVPAVHTTYVAQWNIKSYEVYFDCNGGTCGGNGYHTMQYGDPIVAPTCTKTGYTFTGWSPTIPATMPAANVTYVAQWSINTYEAYFDCNGGICGGNGIHPIQYNSAIVPPTCTRTGYTFAGWSPSVPATMPASEVTYVAQWIINQYTVSFDVNGGTGSADSVTQDYNTAVALPTGGFAKTGYTFIGWNTDPQATEVLAFYLVPADDSTLYAIYQINQYTVSFDANGGSTPADITQDYGTPVTPPADPTRTGYAFVCWIPAIPATMPAADVTYEAQWTLIQQTITYNPCNGEEPIIYTIEPGDEIPIPPDPVWAGHIFCGWTPVPPTTMPAENIECFAQWFIIHVPPFIIDPPFTIDGEFIYGLWEGITQAEFENLCADAIDGNSRLEVTTLDGSFGTGTKVELIDNANEDVVGTWYIVIFGDLNGDGIAGAIDADLISNYENFIVEWDPVTESYFFKAGDLNGDGNIEALDADIVLNAENFIMWIDQTTGLAYEY